MCQYWAYSIFLFYWLTTPSGEGVFNEDKLDRPHLQKRITVKPVLSGHSKIAKTKILKTNGSLMKVESIAECSRAFCNTFDLHQAIIGLENLFEWPLKTGFTVIRANKKR